MKRLFMFLVNGTNKLPGYFSHKFNSNTDRIIHHTVEKNHFSLKPTLALVKTLGNIARYVDWISLFSILAGVIIVSTSLIGNNGKWRKKGRGLIIAGYIWIIGAHFIIISVPAMGNFGNMRIISFALMLIGQILFYVVSAVLYAIGSHQAELYEMSSQSSNRRNATSAYHFMIVVMLIGASSYFVAGMF
ncbi:Uncharacterized protein JF73_17850 (plasmid) [Lactobacillus helsingborgensis]|uniref:Uncharacterized protein n=3 Tax=Lactobacillaceae TaxID=33958 RepID=A0AA47B5U4_9LACO|nr:hypothetical protein [Lactobacillus helsingborgensis]KJY54767.1 Uncharacterized protein JF74_19510 [Lactobacillus melliventris]KJY60604.1 Uncharacterized protein JF73_17850 [Lactobacillus helsingborgensis]UZX30542.1 hypothetical protein LDX53_09195 [Lactobacillus helsingborgensis]